MENINEQLPKIKESFTTVTTLSKIVAGIFFITLPFLGFYLGYNFQKAPSIVIQEQIVEGVAKNSEPEIKETPEVVRQKAEITKKSFYGGEIPVSWSQYADYNAEVIEDDSPVSRAVKFSFADIKVSFSDWNATQVDFYLLTKEARDIFIDDAKKRALENEEIIISEEQIGGVPVTVIKWPLDDGTVTKGGTGGSSYLIKLGYRDYSDAEYLRIEKQAMGDDEFEKAFLHYLKTADFTKDTVI